MIGGHSRYYVPPYINLQKHPRSHWDTLTQALRNLKKLMLLRIVVHGFSEDTGTWNLFVNGNADDIFPPDKSYSVEVDFIHDHTA